MDNPARRSAILGSQEELRRSLDNPHPESGEVARLGAAEWFSLAADGGCGLVDPNAGTPVRWVAGTGWVEVTR
jgi:hypothetical protein